MTRFSMIGRLATLVVLGFTLAGCVVLPFGHGRHGGGHRHYQGADAAPSERGGPVRDEGYRRGR